MHFCHNHDYTVMVNFNYYIPLSLHILKKDGKLFSPISVVRLVILNWTHIFSKNKKTKY